jgi:hypothetical protein
LIFYSLFSGSRIDSLFFIATGGESALYWPKSAIYRILASPKFFRSIPFSRKSQYRFPRKSLYHFPAGAYTVFWQVPLPFFSESKIFKPLQLFSKQDNKQDNKQPRQWSKQFFAIEVIAAKLIVT